MRSPFSGIQLGSLLGWVMFVAGFLATADAADAPNRERQIISVNGVKLEAEWCGTGGPTVIFELGSGGTLETWEKILPRVGEHTKAISYTRAGHGNSEKSTLVRSPARIAEELHMLLVSANVPPPYILVGRSLGGIYVRVFAIKYPNDVAGLVLIDPSHERQEIELSKVLPDYAGSLSVQGPRPEMDEAYQRGDKPPFPGVVPQVPTILITSTGGGRGGPPGAYKQVWRRLHDELFEPVIDGMHIVKPRSGHNIQDDEPELVLTSIRWVVDTARQKIAWAQRQAALQTMQPDPPARVESAKPNP